MRDTTDWTQLREFSGVDLAQSYALSWHLETQALMIDLDLFLNQSHPFYEKPRPAEQACFRPAFLEFPDCKHVETEKDDGKRGIVVTVGSLPPGKISGLKRSADGQYEIRGEFGVVLIQSDRPLLRIKDLLT